MSNFTQDELNALRAPFPLEAHTIREGRKSGGKIVWYVYIERQAVQDLLDTVFPGEWETTKPELYYSQSQYTDDNGVLHVETLAAATVGISIRGITRWDGGDSTGEDQKYLTQSALTNAFRRAAAYGWGIARYTYECPAFKTDGYTKGDWQGYDRVRNEAWKQFSAWYGKQWIDSTMPENAPPQAQKTAQSQQRVSSTIDPFKMPVDAVSDTVPFIAPGDKEWWPVLRKIVYPMYDNPKHAENGIKKLVTDKRIIPSKQSVLEAVRVIEAHIAEKAAQS